MQVAGIRRIGDRAERTEVGELRPLADDWVLLTVMTAGMGNRHESVRTGGWDGGARPLAGRSAARTPYDNPSSGLSPSALVGNGRYARAFPCRPVHSQPHLLGVIYV